MTLRIAPLITCLVSLALARVAVAGPPACLQPLEAAGGVHFFDSTPAANATRCAEALSGSWGLAGGTVACLLHLHHARNLHPALDSGATKKLVALLEESPTPLGAGLDSPIFAEVAELLALVDPTEALATARRLLAYGSSPGRIARGLWLLAWVGERTDLDQLGLFATNNDVALRRVAAQVVAIRGDLTQAELVLPLLSSQEDRTAPLLLDSFARHRPVDPVLLARVLNQTPVTLRAVLGRRLAERLGPASTDPTLLAGLRESPEFSSGFDEGRRVWTELETTLGPDPLAVVRNEFLTPTERCHAHDFLWRADAVLAARPPVPTFDDKKLPPAIQKKKLRRGK